MKTGDNKSRAALADELNGLLADSYALYLKTKGFHWHASGPHFCAYHALFDEQASEILAMTDPIAERVRKLGRAALRSVADVARHKRIGDASEMLSAVAMLEALQADNAALARATENAQVVERGRWRQRDWRLRRQLDREHRDPDLDSGLNPWDRARPSLKRGE